MQLCSVSVLTVLTAVVSAGQHTLANWIRTTWRDLNDPATLYCSEACSGVETWERSGVTVAECGTTGGNGLTCERHLDQSSLSVPEVNYTTRGFYRTRCDGDVICFQNLQPNPHNSSVEVTAGDLLVLDLFTFQPVTLTFSWTGGGGSVVAVQMCTVDGRSLQCNPEYEDRVAVFGNSIVLRAVVSADSGVYTVREINDGAALIRTVSVTVKDVQQSWIWKNGHHKGQGDGYKMGNSEGHQKGLRIGAVGFGIGGLVLGGILGLCVSLKDKCVQRFRRGNSSHVNQTEDEETRDSLTGESHSVASGRTRKPDTLSCVRSKARCAR